jgi:hypothetical protein
VRSVIPILRSVARSCTIALKYPVYKVLKAIAKIFLLNEVEGIFFAYMVRETNWDIRDRLITQNSEMVRDVVSIASDHPEYKCLILYLMLVTYSLKFFLNDRSEELMEEAVRICPAFRAIFENWAKKNSHLTKRINPKTLNKVYQDLYLRIRHEEPDFNLLVDTILQISPAYNPDKNDKDKRRGEDKKEERREGEQGRLAGEEVRLAGEEVRLAREQPTKLLKTEAAVEQLEHNPVFSSSRLYEMAAVGLNISEGSNFQVFGQMNKSINIGTRFGNSVFGSSALLGVPSCPVKDEDYCEELNLGLQEGQSEENINLREDGPPPTSIINLNLSRGISITERYLSLRDGSEYRP